jgi:uncharacterized protein
MSQRADAAPLHWVVLKVAQRCNLNCSYCYVYNRGDESWRERPVFISDAVVAALGRRITEQAEAHSLPSFTIELHGGEPLLLGKRRMQHLIDRLREHTPGLGLRFILQTNGLLLDAGWLELFERNAIRFGVSLDGSPAVADRRRVGHDGRGRTRELLERIAALRAAGPTFDELNSGALCVIDPESDGAEMVRWFAGQGFRAVDFLLPDGNRANPPEGWVGPEPYRRFLVDAFREWYGMGDAAPRIRTFEVLVRGFMGVAPVLDAFGGDMRALCVVETNGAIGLSDTLRICGGPFALDSLDVFRNGLAEAAEHYGLTALQRPSAPCRECRFLDCCGGGYLPHRFDGAGFDNPSLYCDALYGLADTIYRHLRADVPAGFWTERATPEPAGASQS